MYAEIRGRLLLVRDCWPKSRDEGKTMSATAWRQCAHSQGGRRKLGQNQIKERLAGFVGGVPGEEHDHGLRQGDQDIRRMRADVLGKDRAEGYEREKTPRKNASRAWIKTEGDRANSTGISDGNCDRWHLNLRRALGHFRCPMPSTKSRMIRSMSAWSRTFALIADSMA